MKLSDEHRKVLLCEIDDLSRDFDRLILADVTGFIRTDRQKLLSRSSIPKPTMTMAGWHSQKCQQGCSVERVSAGLKVGDIYPRSYEEFKSAPKFYCRFTGEPEIDMAGESLILEI